MAPADAALRDLGEIGIRHAAIDGLLGVFDAHEHDTRTGSIIGL